MKERIELWWSRLPPHLKSSLAIMFFNKNYLVISEAEITNIYIQLIAPDTEVVHNILDEIINDLKVDEENNFENFSLNWYQRLVNKIKLS